MNLLKTVIPAVLSASLVAAQAQPPAVPPSFASIGPDRVAIDALLANYTRAVSTKDQALFETLLLSRDIPFSDAGSAIKARGPEGTHRYEAFRRGVFEGPAFTQKFQDVHVDQDGPLAQVSLVFVNTDAHGSGWGWKTLQLLKVDGQWKIASEFYTGHG
jgi:hypothetical protein